MNATKGYVRNLCCGWHAKNDCDDRHARNESMNDMLQRNGITVMLKLKDMWEMNAMEEIQDMTAMNAMREMNAMNDMRQMNAMTGMREMNAMKDMREMNAKRRFVQEDLVSHEVFAPFWNSVSLTNPLDEWDGTCQGRTFVRYKAFFERILNAKWSFVQEDLVSHECSRPPDLLSYWLILWIGEIEGVRGEH